MNNFDILAAEWEMELGMAKPYQEDQVILSDYLSSCDSVEIACEIKILYGRFFGMPKDEYRWKDFYFWSSREAVKYSACLNQNDFLFFADLSLQFTVFSVKLNGDNAGKVYYGHGAKVRAPIAPSLNVFFGLVIEDVSKLYL